MHGNFNNKIYMNAYKENWEKNIPGVGDYIIAYSEKGKYLNSFYPVSKWARENNLGYFSQCFLIWMIMAIYMRFKAVNFI